VKRNCLCLLMCLLLALPVCASAEDGRQINRSCRIYFANGTDRAYRLNNGSMLDPVEMSDSDSYVFHIDPMGQSVDAVCVQYGEYILPYRVQAQDAQGAWQDIAVYDAEYAQGYASFPQRSEPFRILFYGDEKKAKLSLREIYVFAPGEGLPEQAGAWQPACEKADMLVIAAHPDDELLWFGGTIPTYAGELGYAVQVMYMTCGQPSRRLELLGGLWECGVRNYPDIGDFYDGHVKSMAAAYKKWGEDETYLRIVRAIRRYRPEVIVTHDINGEYGHYQHMVTSDAVYTAVQLAADETYDEQSLQAYGAWQVKKLYRHLGKTPTTVMDWSTPLSAFDGATGMEIASRAFALHVSQAVADWKVAAKGSRSDSTLYTLCYSTVGEDVAGNDFFEHIDR
jgi:LmbE family N-acetylglucosaminyl deacetylase